MNLKIFFKKKKTKKKKKKKIKNKIINNNYLIKILSLMISIIVLTLDLKFL